MNMFKHALRGQSAMMAVKRPPNRHTLSHTVARSLSGAGSASSSATAADPELRAGEEVGLVLERLGDRLLVEPYSLTTKKMPQGAPSQGTSHKPASAAGEDAGADATASINASAGTGVIVTRSVPLLCSQRGSLNVGNAVVGDRVVFRRHQYGSDRGSSNASNRYSAHNNANSGSREKGVVVHVRERRNLLQRPTGDATAAVARARARSKGESKGNSDNSGGSGCGSSKDARGGPRRKSGLKPLAANVDTLAVVLCGRPAVLPSTVDRLLVAAAAHHMRCIIVLNKIDECDEGTETARAHLQHYPALGYPVVEVSAATGAGLGTLRAHLSGGTSVFVGQSGVGKSSLVNALVPHAHTRVGHLVRSTESIGAHTTSTGRLFHFASDAGVGAEVGGQGHSYGYGSLIDSPGLREIGLWHLPRVSICAGFAEIAALAQRCRYRDCAHTEGAPGCAVQVGLQAGLVHPSRLQHMHHYLEQ